MLFPSVVPSFAIEACSCLCWPDPSFRSFRVLCWRCVYHVVLLLRTHLNRDVEPLLKENSHLCLALPALPPGACYCRCRLLRRVSYQPWPFSPPSFALRQCLSYMYELCSQIAQPHLGPCADHCHHSLLRFPKFADFSYLRFWTGSALLMQVRKDRKETWRRRQFPCCRRYLCRRRSYLGQGRRRMRRTSMCQHWFRSGYL
mmetsp:Transcript_23965/g.68889  ORF Transcript_23965/g.68889 Transcript_23965/m.68889 type:complete len:201 (+) Transcript_23965:871-1473(+)